MTNDIKAQQAAASRLGLQIDQEASDLRRRVSGLEWHAGAGDTFRRVIEDFTRELDGCAGDINNLASDIGAHATAAESHAQAAKTVLHVVTLGLL